MIQWRAPKSLDAGMDFGMSWATAKCSGYQWPQSRKHFAPLVSMLHNWSFRRVKMCEDYNLTSLHRNDTESFESASYLDMAFSSPWQPSAKSILQWSHVGRDDRRGENYLSSKGKSSTAGARKAAQNRAVKYSGCMVGSHQVPGDWERTPNKFSKAGQQRSK